MSGHRFGLRGGGKAELTIDALATVRLELDSRPECITLVRSMLAGLGEYLELDPELLDDLKTAISEACNNVVLHAYGDASGPLEMSLSVTEDDFEVSIRDHGVGIQRVSPAENRMGVGLALISALARRAEFQSEPGQGTEVKMSFGIAGVGAREALRDRGGVMITPTPGQVGGDILVTVGPADLLGQVMGRLVRAVAASEYFSVDRFASLHVLTSAISARAAATGQGEGEVTFAISGKPKHLDLRVGPLPSGSSEDLFAAPAPSGLDGLIERVGVAPMPQGELLEVVVAEPPR